MGLDHHQNVVRVCVVDAEGNVLVNRKVKNCTATIAKVVRRLGQPVGVAVEACSGAADLADKLHQKSRWSVSLAPTQGSWLA